MDNTSNRIHLIERLGHFTKLQNGEWESAWWHVNEETAKDLVGGSLYCHRKKRELSYFGGQIIGYRVEDSGEYKGRIIFRFKFDQDHRRVSAGPEPWQFEKKVVIKKKRSP